MLYQNIAGEWAHSADPEQKEQSNLVSTQFAERTVFAKHTFFQIFRGFIRKVCECMGLEGKVSSAVEKPLKTPVRTPLVDIHFTKFTDSFQNCQILIRLHSNIGDP